MAASSPAQATPATQEGADKLRATIESRIGKDIFENDFLRIVPDGEIYDFIFDANKVPDRGEGFHAKLPLVTLHVTPGEDGTYTFVSEPLSFATTTPPAGVGTEPSSGGVENCRAQGRFNPAVLYLSTLAATCDRVTIHDRSKDPADLDIGKVAFDWSARPAEGGTADIGFTLDAPDLVGDFPDEGSHEPHARNLLKVGRFHYAVAVSRVRAQAIADLYALWMETERLKQDKPAPGVLKQKLEAVLPVWDNIRTETSFDDLSVTAPNVTARIDHYGEKQALSGAVKDAHYAVDFELAGVGIDVGAKANWLAPLLPSQASLHLKVADVDLAGAADAVLRSLDHDGAGLDTALPPILLNGKATIATDLKIKAQAYDIQGKGEAPIDPRMQGGATISATGFDAVMAAASRFGSTDGRNMMLGLALIKGLAKTGPDGRLVWNVAVDIPARKFTVNGQTFDLPEK